MQPAPVWRKARPLLGRASCAVFFAFLFLTPARAAVDLRTDKRLDARVTLALGHAGLDAVLSEAGRQASVDVRAGKDESDWLSRELPVAVFVKELSLRDLMEQLALLTGFHWTATGEDATPAYRLWQDEKARQDQGAKRQARETAVRAERVRQSLSNLNALAELGSLPPERWEELAGSNPMVQMMTAIPGFRPLPRLISQIPDFLKAQTTEPEGLRIPYGLLEADQQSQLRDCIAGWWEMARRMDPQWAAGRPEQPPALDQATIVIRPVRPEDGLTLPGLPNAFTGIATLEGVELPAGPRGLPIFDPKGPAGELVGRYVVDAMQGASRRHLEVAALESFRTLAARGFGLASAPPSDPVLLKSIKPENPGPTLTLGDLLAAVHRASGLDVIADSLPQPELVDANLTSALAQEGTVHQLLARLRAVCGLEHERVGSLLRLRDVDWAVKRDWLVPAEQTARWERKAGTKEGLVLGDLVEVAALTEDQIRHGLRESPRLVPLSEVPPDGTWPLLRFLGALTVAQRTRLESGARLELSTLTPEQWRLLGLAWAEATGARASDRPGPVPEGALALEPPSSPASGTPGPSSAEEPGTPLLKRKSVGILLELERMDRGPSEAIRLTFRARVPESVSNGPGRLPQSPGSRL